MLPCKATLTKVSSLFSKGFPKCTLLWFSYRQVRVKLTNLCMGRADNRRKLQTPSAHFENPSLSCSSATAGVGTAK